LFEPTGDHTAACHLAHVHVPHLGCIARTSFTISVQLNLDQKLNRVYAVLRCTKLNSDQLIPFSWTAVVIPWTTLIGQPRLAYGPTTMTSQSHAMLMKQSSADWL